MAVSPEPALAVAAGAATWKTIQAFIIPSSSVPGHWYVATSLTCSCKAFSASSSARTCKHVEGVRLVENLAPSPCTNLSLQQTNDGLAWLPATAA